MKKLSTKMTGMYHMIKKGSYSEKKTKMIQDRMSGMLQELVNARGV
jgi:hypothetical protein